MDYRALLKKYINHVAECEGTTFLRGSAPREMSEEDWAELQKLDKESEGEPPVLPPLKKPEKITPEQLADSLARLATDKETNG